MIAQNAKLLLTAEETAEMLSVSRSFLYQMISSGRLPQPIKLGGASRWRRAELEAWVKQGCPCRDKWIYPDTG